MAVPRYSKTRKSYNYKFFMPIKIRAFLNENTGELPIEL